MSYTVAVTAIRPVEVRPDTGEVKRPPVAVGVWTDGEVFEIPLKGALADACRAPGQYRVELSPRIQAAMGRFNGNEYAAKSTV